MTEYHNPEWTEKSRFRGAPDDVIIIPLVLVTLAANKNPAFHSFHLDAAAQLRLPFRNAGCLASAGLAREQGGRTAYARNLLQTLERRELAEVAAQITNETGLGYAEIKQGDRLSGTYRRMLTLNSGRFALIERAHDFSFVPLATGA